MRWQRCGWLGLALFAGLAGHADVRLPHLLSDHGVLQREMPIHIWGWADPGEQVSIAFHAQKLAATAD
ncbi:MAG TPA: sialate O-acetylesterase, partial [Acidobacteriaceae bacterium]